MNIDLFFPLLLAPPPSPSAIRPEREVLLLFFLVFLSRPFRRRIDASPSVSGNISLQHSLLRIKKYVMYVSEAPPESVNQGMCVYMEEGGRRNRLAKSVFLFFRFSLALAGFFFFPELFCSIPLLKMNFIVTA